MTLVMLVSNVIALGKHSRIHGKVYDLTSVGSNLEHHPSVIMSLPVFVLEVMSYIGATQTKLSPLPKAAPWLPATLLQICESFQGCRKI